MTATEKELIAGLQQRQRDIATISNRLQEIDGEMRNHRLRISGLTRWSEYYHTDLAEISKALERVSNTIWSQMYLLHQDSDKIQYQIDELTRHVDTGADNDSNDPPAHVTGVKLGRIGQYTRNTSNTTDGVPDVPET